MQLVKNQIQSVQGRDTKPLLRTIIENRKKIWDLNGRHKYLRQENDETVFALKDQYNEMDELLKIYQSIDPAEYGPKQKHKSPVINHLKNLLERTDTFCTDQSMEDYRSDDDRF